MNGVPPLRAVDACASAEAALSEKYWISWTRYLTPFCCQLASAARRKPSISSSRKSCAELPASWASSSVLSQSPLSAAPKSSQSCAPAGSGSSSGRRSPSMASGFGAIAAEAWALRWVTG